MDLIHIRLMNDSSKQNSLFFKEFYMKQNQAQRQFFRHVLKVSICNASLIFMLCIIALDVNMMEEAQ